MNTSSPRYTVNCSMLFTELPLLERPAAAKAAGFDAVEFWWPFAEAVPADQDVDDFVGAVHDAGVQLIGLNFFAGDMPGGDRGLVSWPARSGEFRDNIDVVVGIAERLGSRAFNALYGNRVDDSTAGGAGRASPSRTWRWPPRAAGPHRRRRAGRAGQRRPALPAAHRGRRARRDRPGGTRPASTTCGCCATSTTWPSTATMSPTRSRRTSDRIGHVQIADARAAASRAPARWTSTGYLTTLAAKGYDGYVGLEYKPTDDHRGEPVLAALATRPG